MSQQTPSYRRRSPRPSPLGVAPRTPSPGGAATLWGHRGGLRPQGQPWWRILATAGWPPRDSGQNIFFNLRNEWKTFFELFVWKEAEEFLLVTARQVSDMFCIGFCPGNPGNIRDNFNAGNSSDFNFLIMRELFCV